MKNIECMKKCCVYHTSVPLFPSWHTGLEGVIFNLSVDARLRWHVCTLILERCLLTGHMYIDSPFPSGKVNGYSFI